MSTRARMGAWIVGLAGLLASCSGGGGGPHAVFELPREGEEPQPLFFDLPWPTDLRRTAEGTIDVRDFPKASSVPTLRDYLEAISAEVDGYATNVTAYLRFSEPVDPGSLPATPQQTLEDGASVFIVDVDPDSPSYGERHPAVVRYQQETTTYWPQSTVAVRPVHGMPYAAETTYAAVVTDGVEPAAGGAFARDSDFADIARPDRGDEAVSRARTIYGPALDAVAAAGVARERVLSLAVFTTQDPVADMIAMRDWVVDEYPAPEARDWTWVEDTETYTLLEGVWGPMPQLQQGELPYDSAPSGRIEMSEGAPVVAQDLELRFALTVPTTEMPAEGYPLVLYAHGSGGDYKTFVRSGVAEQLGAAGLAVMGIDQNLHGERNPEGAAPELLFFNYFNPYAARDNVRQSAIDVVQQARLASSLEVSTRAIDADPPVTFDPDRLFFYGHSQGGLNGPLFLAIDDSVKAAVLSGSGGTFAVSLVDKEEPLDIKGLVKLLLRLPGASGTEAYELESFVYEHPVLSLLQTWVEPADPVVYGPMFFRRPREGFAPKSILQTEGLMDRFTPPKGMESLAGSAGIPIVEPVHAPIDALDLRGIGPATAPLSGNVADGEATAGLLQFPDQGHFVVFRDAGAGASATELLRSAAEGTPRIVAP